MRRNVTSVGAARDPFAAAGGRASAPPARRAYSRGGSARHFS